MLCTCDNSLKCTEYYPGLAVDASHLFVLHRLVQQLDGTPSDSMCRLILAHTCTGDRQLVSSRHCYRVEVIGNAELSHYFLDARNSTSIDTDCPDDEFEELPETSPESDIAFGERDRRMAAAAHRYAHTTGVSPTWLVTDDEDLLLCIREFAEILNVYAVHSCELLLSLYRCGGVNQTHIEAMLAAEGIRIQQDGAMGVRKRRAKLSRLNQIASIIGLETA